MNNIWDTLIYQAQGHIATHSPHPNYTQHYQPSEIMYWSHIPQWIYEQPRHDNMTCLDIGCAYGTLAIYTHLLGYQTYCTDFIDEYISDELLQVYNIQFKINNIETDALPWAKQFDMIIFTEVLEHLNFHPITTLHKIRSILHPNGYLYLSTPDVSQWGKANYYHSLNDIPTAQQGIPIIDDHIYIYDINELHDIITKSGFKIIQSDFAPGSHGNRHFNMQLKGG